MLFWREPPRLVHSVGNFLSVRPADQQRRQLEKIFKYNSCIMGQGVGLLARTIRLAMTMGVEL